MSVATIKDTLSGREVVTKYRSTVTSFPAGANMPKHLKRSLAFECFKSVVLNLLEVLNPAGFIRAVTEPFVK